MIAIITIIIAILITVIIAGAALWLLVMLFQNICTKWLFHYSNDDKEYIKRCENKVNLLEPIGQKMLTYAQEQQLEDDTQIMITIQENRVLFDNGDRTIDLNEEELQALLALDEILIPGMMNRMIFHNGRVGFHSQINWKTCVYVKTDKKPRFLYLKKESFQSRCKKIAPHWYMMFA